VIESLVGDCHLLIGPEVPVNNSKSKIVYDDFNFYEIAFTPNNCILQGLIPKLLTLSEYLEHK